MEDKEIIDLYWLRSETAIAQTARKYGRYCRSIAHNILHNAEDSEECVSDTYLKAWENIPPRRPKKLAVFLGKITRNLALDRYRFYTAEKRGGGQMPVALEELAACVPAGDETGRIIDQIVLVELLNRFLGELPVSQRKIFMRRYWYVSDIKEIARDYAMTESGVRMSLMRSRKQLKELLEKEGVML